MGPIAQMYGWHLRTKIMSLVNLFKIWEQFGEKKYAKPRFCLEYEGHYRPTQS